MGTGQANVKADNQELRDLTHVGKATPSWLISHHLSRDEGPEAMSISTPVTTAGQKLYCTPTATGLRCEDQ